METIQDLLESLRYLPARKKLLILLVLASLTLAAIYLRPTQGSQATSLGTPTPTATVRPWWAATPTLAVAPPTPMPISPAQGLPPATQAPAVVRGRVTTGLNVRSGPGTSYAKVSGLPAGTEVTIYERNNDGSWLRIGQGQWVAGQYVELLP